MSKYHSSNFPVSKFIDGFIKINKLLQTYRSVLRTFWWQEGFYYCPLSCRGRERVIKVKDLIIRLLKSILNFFQEVRHQFNHSLVHVIHQINKCRMVCLKIYWLASNWNPVYVRNILFWTFSLWVLRTFALQRTANANKVRLCSAARSCRQLSLLKLHVSLPDSTTGLIIYYYSP